MDQSQVLEWYLVIDTDALMDQASKALGVKCKGCEHLATCSVNKRHFYLFLEESDDNKSQLARFLVKESNSWLDRMMDKYETKYVCLARHPFGNCEHHFAAFNSEISTIRYLKANTKIPVPEIIYTNLDPKNSVGRPFVLMEQMPGKPLVMNWCELSLETQKNIIIETASLFAKLADTRFDTMGSLQETSPSVWEVGPLVGKRTPRGPFTSFEDSCHARLYSDDPRERGLAGGVKKALDDYLESHRDASYLKPPFVLIPCLDGDFVDDDILFTKQADGSVKLSGLLDFWGAYTGPLYKLLHSPYLKVRNTEGVVNICGRSELETMVVSGKTIQHWDFVRAAWDLLPDADARASLIGAWNGRNCFLDFLPDIDDGGFERAVQQCMYVRPGGRPWQPLPYHENGEPVLNDPEDSR